MQIIEKSIDELIPYAQNPRCNDEAVDAVASSIASFGFNVPCVIDSHNVLITGHTRLKAAKKLGLKTVPCICADSLTPAQVKAYRLADNKVSELASWDMSLLESELAQLDDLQFDMTPFGFDEELESEEDESILYDTQNKLADEFIVPPVSILDTRSGLWQERKRVWKKLGIDSEVGRDKNLIAGREPLNKFQKVRDNGNTTSIFDPVLCEICYKWFCTVGGTIFDCFAGGSVRGIVAEMTGHHYTGIDLRQEQIDANYENAKALNVKPMWLCDDSCNADVYVPDSSVDMLFTCPPYADLEVYSDDPRDISNMSHEDFIKKYSEILTIAGRKVKPDRFAVVVIGDVRDKKGYYLNLIDITKRIFLANGYGVYNHLILIEQLGNACFIMRRCFNGLRKVVKQHQDVLVFYKGDIRKIKENYIDVTIPEDDTEEMTDE